YIKHLETDGDLDYQTALLYAKQQGFSVYFWEKDPNRPYQMKLVASYDAGEKASKILHFDLAGSTGFNVLLPEEISIEQLYGKQPRYTFTVEPPKGSPYPSDQFDPSYPIEVKPSYYYEYDHWNNLTKVTDTLGNETTYTYSLNNQRISETKPEVNCVQTD